MPLLSTDFHLYQVSWIFSQQNDTHCDLTLSTRRIATPQTITKITHLEYNRATHHAAEALNNLSDYNSSTPKVVAVLATADTLVYAAVFVGTLRAGLVPFFLSPAIAPTALVSLMQSTGSTRILTSLIISPRYTYLALACASRHSFPTLAQKPAIILSKPFGQTIAKSDVESDVYWYLHSSGSTGVPKAIPHTRRSFISWGDRDYIRLWRNDPVPPCLGNMALSLYNTLGIAAGIITPLMCGSTAAIFSPIVRGAQLLPYTPLPGAIIDHARRSKCDGIVGAPVLAHAWSQSADALKYLITLMFVFYAGSALLPKIGGYMASQGVPLVCSYGLTESGAFWI
ncbi:hypothetical protein BDV98DRAFT_593202 [Pterulicium gracile]|uniref:AMP-dependent synthetase/ligase domain-containing protein n=1 Tax=Pterulicium gracile TaxID=1884261 RepID=A0A5C3QGT9_9AGAR|nr:hypothetical protein BDV98DRAFT_593202 [Pterula gracilis]